MLPLNESKRILHYRMINGRIPFQEWMESLRDKEVKTHIFHRLDRVANGNFGIHRRVGAGVVELKIDRGPGYRLYLGQQGEELVILLCGGDKSSQQRDIMAAHTYWEDFKRRL